MPLSKIRKFKFPEASRFMQPLEETEPKPLFIADQTDNQWNKYGYQNRELDPIIVNAQKEAEKIKKEAYEKGFQQGMTEGFKKGKEDGFLHGVTEAEHFLNDLKKILEELIAFRKQLLQKMEKEVLEFALAIAKKIVKQEVVTNQEVILGNIREAINKLTDTDEIFIKVNPEDYDFIMRVRPDFLDKLNEGKGLHIIEDKGIKKGGCLIETKFSQIDARIDTQWDNLEQAFLKAIGE